MVTLLHPTMHPDAERLRSELFRTNTLFGSIAVGQFEQQSTMLKVLQGSVKVVIPDTPSEFSEAFTDVVTALQLIKFPVQRASAYLESITAPAGHCAAPTNQHSDPVGATVALR